MSQQNFHQLIEISCLKDYLKFFKCLFKSSLIGGKILEQNFYHSYLENVYIKSQQKMQNDIYLDVKMKQLETSACKLYQFYVETKLIILPLLLITDLSFKKEEFGELNDQRIGKLLQLTMRNQ